MFKRLQEYCEMLDGRSRSIGADRTALLNPVIEYSKYQSDLRLNFICTHNSRRSHFAMVWASIAAVYYEKDRVEFFSGGSEVTACNPRTIEALKRSGFEVSSSKEVDNPHYLLNYGDKEEPIEVFSKLITDPVNPQRDFAAIMTCSDADENCPIVPGATARFPMHYVDPKISDGTSDEEQTYDEKSKEIGTEMFYIFKNLTFR